MAPFSFVWASPLERDQPQVAARSFTELNLDGVTIVVHTWSMTNTQPPQPNQWRRITDEYWVSNSGQVWSTIVGRLLKTKVSKVGYENINLKRLGTKMVHSLVAEAWLPAKTNVNMVVDHIDGNKLNNRADNLEWVSRKDNTSRAFALGLIGKVGAPRGFTPAQVYQARNRRLSGVSMAAIAAELGSAVVTARNAVYGISYADLIDVPPLPLPREPGTWRPGAGGKRHEGPHAHAEGHPRDYIPSPPTEVWLRLNDGVTGYWLSDQGRVFSTKSRKLKKSVVNTKQQNYLRVQLRTDDGLGYKSFMLHRLVADYFLPPPIDPSYIVGHLNENPQDPRASNLAWISRRENAQRSHTAKTRPSEVYDIQSFLAAHQSIERNQRIGGVMLDALVPSKRIGIIFDDIQTTSELMGMTRYARTQAMQVLDDNGICAVRVFSNEWHTSQDLVQSMLLHRIGSTKNRIMARDTEVREVPTAEAAAFLNSNHLQGTVGSRVKLGCYHQGQLVAIATFGIPRYGAAEGSFELLRFANVMHTTVVGGFSKLLTHFRRNYNLSHLISFADRRWSSGNMYAKSGFELTRTSNPNYFYFRPDSPNDLHSRVIFQKHKLKDKLAVFDDSLTEVENMRANGWDRIWDCGNLVFEMKL